MTDDGTSQLQQRPPPGHSSDVVAGLGHRVTLECVGGKECFRMGQSQQLIWLDRVTWQQLEAMTHFLYDRARSIPGAQYDHG